MTPLIERIFPALSAAGYTLTSPQNRRYNCIAWAAGDDTDWWWPEPYGEFYWPPSAPYEQTMDAFVQAFGTLGYVPCDNGDVETNTEKIVIYADAGGLPTHAARQLPSGLWTSKLGILEDITHHTLEGISGSLYGTPQQYMKRQWFG